MLLFEQNGFLDYLKNEDPDIMCLQETSIQIEVERNSSTKEEAINELAKRIKKYTK